MNPKHIMTAFRQAWLRYEYDFEADEDSSWTDEDGKHLLEFFSSDTGQRLKRRLTNYVFRAATYALKQKDVVKHAGVAEGIQLGINAIEEHFYVSPIRNTDNPMIEQKKSDPRRLSQLN